MKNFMQVEQEYWDFIENLYREEGKSLYCYAKTVFHNTAITEEVVQETFLLICKNAEKLKDNTNLKSHIFHIHKVVCGRLQHQYNKYIQKLLSLQADNQNFEITKNFSNEENNLGQYVNEKEFFILQKIILDGYSYQELAEELGITLNVCKKRIQRAKEHFKQNYLQQ